MATGFNGAFGAAGDGPSERSGLLNQLIVMAN